MPPNNAAKGATCLATRGSVKALLHTRLSPLEDEECIWEVSSVVNTDSKISKRNSIPFVFAYLKPQDLHEARKPQW